MNERKAITANDLMPKFYVKSESRMIPKRITGGAEERLVYWVMNRDRGSIVGSWYATRDDAEAVADQLNRDRDAPDVICNVPTCPCGWDDRPFRTQEAALAARWEHIVAEHAELLVQDAGRVQDIHVLDFEEEPEVKVRPRPSQPHPSVGPLPARPTRP